MNASAHFKTGAFDLGGQGMPVGGSWSAVAEPDPAPAGEAPLFTEPVIGYRAWRIADGELFSPYRRGHWPPGAAVAECVNAIGEVEAEHRAPAPGCSCGLYAYHSVDQLHPGYSHIVGAVVGWGEIHVHSTGWRAERACVVALRADECLLPYDPHGVARRYGVPLVTSHAELEAEATKHGSPLPSDVVPEGPLVTFAKMRSLVVSGTWMWTIEPAPRRPPRGPRARGGRARGQRRRRS